MRTLPLLAAMLALAVLPACGTKTPLKLPPPAQAAASAMAPTPAAVAADTA